MDASCSATPIAACRSNIANAHGWELLSPCAFQIKWNGGMEAGRSPCARSTAYEHFKFRDRTSAAASRRSDTSYLFCTSPGWRLLATGPPTIQASHDAADQHRGDRLAALSVHDELAADEASGIVRFGRTRRFLPVFPVRQGAGRRDAEPSALEATGAARSNMRRGRPRTDFLGRLNADDQAQAGW